MRGDEQFLAIIILEQNKNRHPLEMAILLCVLLCGKPLHSKVAKEFADQRSVLCRLHVLSGRLVANRANDVAAIVTLFCIAEVVLSVFDHIGCCRDQLSVRHETNELSFTIVHVGDLPTTAGRRDCSHNGFFRTQNQGHLLQTLDVPSNHVLCFHKITSSCYLINVKLKYKN
jgi:hypothetical protein